MTYLRDVLCACGAEATANGRECPRCWRGRLLSVGIHYAPTKNVGGIDPDKQRRWDKRLESYASARREGIQPLSARQQDVDLAREVSDATQEAFDGGRLSKVEANV